MSQTPAMNARGFERLPQKPPNIGYYNYGTPREGVGQWGRPETIEVIEEVGKVWRAKGEPPFGVGNMSLEDGRKFPPHSSEHSDGTSADIRPPRKDGRQDGVKFGDPAYDREATQRLVDMFWATGRVERIYFNDPEIKGAVPFAGHDDHLHIRIKHS